jgi:hypothetical protein
MRKLLRFGALSADEMALFAEAWVRIAVARVLARRAHQVTSSAPRPTRGRSSLQGRDTSRRQKDLDLPGLERAFLLAARHHPGTVGCVPRSRALRTFLESRGHEVRVRIGLRRDVGGRLEGHAWAEVGGRPLAEGPILASFHPIAFAHEER